jgi:hypothetical protein
MKDYKKLRNEAKGKCSSRELKRKIAAADLKGPGRSLRVCRELLTEASLRSYGVPEFYVDEYYNCVECGVESLFSAEKQKEWYEVDKRDIYVRPCRCPQHFIEWLSGRKAKYWMDVAIEKLKADPDSKDAMLRYAMSVVSFHKNTGNGNLNSAIHILRKLDKDKDALEYCTEQMKNRNGEAGESQLPVSD